jgi:hypothetical protein
MIAVSLNNPKNVVLQILKEDLRKRKLFLLHDNVPAHKAVFAHFLPQKLLQLSRFICTRLYLVSQVENEVKRTLLDGSC